MRPIFCETLISLPAQTKPPHIFRLAIAGLAALALGDPTAREQRRLSLNPLRHIDPVGTLLVPGALSAALPSRASTRPCSGAAGRVVIVTSVTVTLSCYIIKMGCHNADTRFLAACRGRGDEDFAMAAKAIDQLAQRNRPALDDAESRRTDMTLR